MTASDTPYQSIKNVSTLLGVEPHTLRYWEKKVLYLSPKKGTGGHRYYDENDVTFLKNIHFFLKKCGYTIKGLNTLIRKKGVGAFKSINFENQAVSSLEDAPFSLQSEIDKDPSAQKNARGTLDDSPEKMVRGTLGDALGEMAQGTFHNTQEKILGNTSGKTPSPLENETQEMFPHEGGSPENRAKNQKNIENSENTYEKNSIFEKKQQNDVSVFSRKDLKFLKDELNFLKNALLSIKNTL